MESEWSGGRDTLVSGVREESEWLGVGIRTCQESGWSQNGNNEVSRTHCIQVRNCQRINVKLNYKYYVI